MPPRRLSLDELGVRIVNCERCPRLREHCKQVATEKRAAYRDWNYHGKPVPGFGDPSARLWIIGLAPGAHGANRTGRVFTGDRSGDFLYAALHRAGYANRPTSTSIDDGLRLKDCYISAACRCAPPGNKPTRAELANCSNFLDAELSLLRNVRVILALGKIAWDASVALLRPAGHEPTTRAAVFAHSAEHRRGKFTLLGSYHVSQQNTFTGRLTPGMFDAMLARARLAADVDQSGCED